MQTLDTEGNMEKFQAFPHGKIAVTVKGYMWGFKIWEDSAYKMERAMCSNFVKSPSMMTGKMGNITCPTTPCPTFTYLGPHLVPKDTDQIQPLLEHIQASLCAGEETDYAVLMAWIAHVAKYPNKKIGWMPMSSGQRHRQRDSVRQLAHQDL